MILTPHILAGAVAAAKIQNPLIGLPLAFLSHFILDALPHREYSITRISEPKSKNFPRSAGKVLVDFSLGLGLVMWAVGPEINFPYLVGAIFLAILPDFFQLLNLLNPRWLAKFNRWHCDIIHLKYPLPTKWRAGRPKIRRLADWGWASQIVCSAVMLIILIWR